MLDRTTIKNWNSLKFGLVLSGGGAKGAYEAGAIYALHELDYLINKGDQWNIDRRFKCYSRCNE